ncbi:MAG TPA: TolC family protein [Bryobacteraceae bacterium]|nr:TolC family protein [Bryobacteraceae bacterium]
MKKITSGTAIVLSFVLSIPFAALGQSRVNRITGLPEAEEWHSRFTRSYRVAPVSPINLNNSTRLEALLRAGRIYLSLQDAIALALENNLDIELARYGPRIAQADLLRAQAGGVVRGVPTGISQGPGSAGGANLAGTGVATSGSGTAGGGGGGGGASTGGATVLFSGTQTPVLDEQFFVTYNYAHRTSPQANSFLTGIPALVFNNGSVSAGVQRAFLTGTQVQLAYVQNTQESNNVRAEINPFTSGNLNLQVTQPLLRGFGIAVNNRFIRIARNDLKVADLTFRQQVIATVAAVVNLYSDLVSFTEDVKVRRQALSLAEKLYNDNRKQVEIGTLAPIEIVRAEAEVARAQQELTQSETQLLQQETIIKNYLSRTGVGSPVLAEARLVPTDSLRMAETEQIQPIQDLVATAVGNRPELEQTRIAIENAEISLEGSRSQLLPSLDLVAAAQNNGLAGSLNPLPVPAETATGGTPFLRQGNPAFLGGVGSVWSQLLSRNYPDYNIGFQLNIPLRNRAAQADVIRDQLTLRQNQLRQRQELNQIRVDVSNALIALQQSRARFQSAQKSRVLQEQTLDAEQKKYALGASTIFFVIQAQRDLAQAQATEVSALSAYNRARVSLGRSTGQILETYNVSIDEAQQGSVRRQPDMIPAVIPEGGAK